MDNLPSPMDQATSIKLAADLETAIAVIERKLIRDNVDPAIARHELSLVLYRAAVNHSPQPTTLSAAEHWARVPGENATVSPSKKLRRK